ncbi:protein-tyrosine phosphatase-like protein [Dimargaris cristalligena]|uniref:Phosphatidylinositol 3,4,5-trisphosphate 3-phosphatase and dual-specificity protein phosphatase PTEN n=1 Tax=Dimargaris cristalligena TaxID=215637 RepID=A0A4V1J4U4_9FUNG|nr:protein-tyrosine phosphatase-like protein [Dimargaris cristalligena]|eukprot:RKP36769.1 protein-tyrosine phosphatase-like protein [Dimargaris cristalligena]
MNSLRYFTAKNFRQATNPDTGQALNLSYITGQVVAMCFPSEGLESLYRNELSQVASYLDSHHTDHYKVYNLCLEREYQPTKFNAPALEQMHAFCRDVEQWVGEDVSNVAVVHCKAGKGRTGTMICAFLLYSKVAATTADAIDIFGQLRTLDGKGVTIPSQKRYIGYFSYTLDDSNLLRPHPVFLKSITLRLKDTRDRVKILADAWKIYVFDRKHNNEDKLHKERLNQLPLVARRPFYEITVPFEGLQLCGDIRIEVKTQTYLGLSTIFHFWFNTAFMTRPDLGTCVAVEGEPRTSRLTLSKTDLDVLYRMNTVAALHDDFHVEVVCSF